MTCSKVGVSITERTFYSSVKYPTLNVKIYCEVLNELGSIMAMGLFNPDGGVIIVV